MDAEKKEMLLALIDGLAKQKSYSQYEDDGEKIIDQRGINILKATIRSFS